MEYFERHLEKRKKEKERKIIRMKRNTKIAVQKIEFPSFVIAEKILRLVSYSARSRAE
jgi:hypothetical protein